jgi:four helix bundle protein
MAEPIKSYRDLIAWQKAFALGCVSHQLAGVLPADERFALSASLRREARQIASRIAQGYGRGNTNDYLYFLKQARGELYELGTDLLFALEFGYISEDQHIRAAAQVEECERVLAGLIRSLGG